MSVHGDHFKAQQPSLARHTMPNRKDPQVFLWLYNTKESELVHLHYVLLIEQWHLRVSSASIRVPIAGPTDGHEGPMLGALSVFEFKRRKRKRAHGAGVPFCSYSESAQNQATEVNIIYGLHTQFVRNKKDST